MAGFKIQVIKKEGCNNCLQADYVLHPQKGQKIDCHGSDKTYSSETETN